MKRAPGMDSMWGRLQDSLHACFGLKREKTNVDGIKLPVVGKEGKFEQVRNFYPSTGKSKSTGLPVRLTLKRAFPKVGRNEPCPCGSGKKYKQCCAIKHNL